jgi:hypothetical protein
MVGAFWYDGSMHSPLHRPKEKTASVRKLDSYKSLANSVACASKKLKQLMQQAHLRIFDTRVGALCLCI